MTFISLQDYKSLFLCIFYIVTMPWCLARPRKIWSREIRFRSPPKTLVTHIRFRAKSSLGWDSLRGDQDCFAEILDEEQVCTFTWDPGTFGNSCWCHSHPEIWSACENRKGLELFGLALLFYFCVWCGYLRLISCYHQFSKLGDLMLVADILDPGKNIF